MCYNDYINLINDLKNLGYSEDEIEDYLIFHQITNFDFKIY